MKLSNKFLLDEVPEAEESPNFSFDYDQWRQNHGSSFSQTSNSEALSPGRVTPPRASNLDDSFNLSGARQSTPRRRTARLAAVFSGRAAQSSPLSVRSEARSPLPDNPPGSPPPVTAAAAQANPRPRRKRANAKEELHLQILEQRLQAEKAKEENYLSGVRANEAAAEAYRKQSRMMEAAAIFYENENRKNGYGMIIILRLHSKS